MYWDNSEFVFFLYLEQDMLIFVLKDCSQIYTSSYISIKFQISHENLYP